MLVALKFVAFLVLGALPAFAQHSWCPSPGMTGSFHAIAGQAVLNLASTGKFTLSWDETSFRKGIIRPDPSGIPHHYLAKLLNPACGEISYCRFAFEPDESIWQILAEGKSPGDMTSLEEKFTKERDGFVSYQLEWFKNRFVPSRPLPPDAIAAPEDARAHLVGSWENFREGFGGGAVLLCPDGSGLFGAAGIALPCTWSVLRTNGTWFVSCTVYDGENRPGPINTTFVLLKPAPRFQRLQLVAIDQTLEAAIAAAEALSPADGPPQFYYRSSPSVPQKLVSDISSAISSILSRDLHPSSDLPSAP